MKDGRWYAVEKFDTTSKCLTYEFKDDPNGEYLVEPDYHVFQEEYSIRQ